MGKTSPKDDKLRNRWMTEKTVDRMRPQWYYRKARFVSDRKKREFEKKDIDNAKLAC